MSPDTRNASSEKEIPFEIQWSAMSVNLALFTNSLT